MIQCREQYNINSKTSTLNNQQMNTNQLSPAARRQRKFLMVLPLLVLPFLTMAFWALGGGKGSEKNVSAPQQGLDTRLPEASFRPDEKEDKFSVYEMLGRETDSSGFDDPRTLSFQALGMADRHEQRIGEKLARIQAEMEKPETEPKVQRSGAPRSTSVDLDRDVRRLEGLIHQIQDPGEVDPEMRQLDAVLDKILEVQDPGRGAEKRTAESRGSGNFYQARVAGQAGADQAIRAVIHQDQTVIAGSVIRLRLQDSVRVGETLVQRNELVHGTVSVNGERLQIEISFIRYGNAILPVKLSAYDLDGLEGLYSPGALTRDAMKEGADDAMQGLRFSTLDPSVSEQLAGAGLQAAKGLFRKKARLVKIRVKAGYRLLLRDRNQRV